MFIVSKDKNSIINAQQTTSIYIGADGCTLKADFGNGKGCQIGRYNSEKECRTAIEILSENIGKSEIFLMPQDNAVSAKINIGEQKQHHINGKKTKGHGGS